MDQYDYNQPVIIANERFTWQVWAPSGKTFTMTASVWLMSTYYSNRPGWRYERI